VSSSQKFIARNRAPRVQIEYDLERNGAKEKIQLPFIMGVMSDLAGKSETVEAKRPLAERKFLEIDVDNFDNRMTALAPRVSFGVKNTLTGVNQLPVDLSFQTMADFAPDAIAKQVPALRQLLEARTQLANLMTYMDGRSDAEELLIKIINNPELMKTLAAAPKAD
jgi:type VI secretion system protein ImpB